MDELIEDVAKVKKIIADVVSQQTNVSLDRIFYMLEQFPEPSSMRVEKVASSLIAELEPPRWIETSESVEDPTVNNSSPLKKIMKTFESKNIESIFNETKVNNNNMEYDLNDLDQKEELLKTVDVVKSGEFGVEGDIRNNKEDIFDLELNYPKLDFEVKDLEVRLRNGENNDGGIDMHVKDEEAFTKMSRFEKAVEPSLRNSTSNAVVDIDLLAN